MKTRASALVLSLAALLATASAGPPAAAQPATAQAASRAFVERLAKDAPACKAQLTAMDLPSVRAVAGCLVKVVQRAGSGALLTVALGLFDDFIVQLKHNETKARQSLGALAARLGALVPALAALAKPIVDGLKAGAKAFVADATRCRAKLTDVSPQKAQAVFTCLRGALRL